MFENFVASIERHQAAVSARFEAFCMEKLQNEYSSGIVSGPNMKQLIVFNQLYAASEIHIHTLPRSLSYFSLIHFLLSAHRRKYLSDLATEMGDEKTDFTTLHQLPEGAIKSEFQAYVARFNEHWAAHRARFLGDAEHSKESNSKRVSLPRVPHQSEPEWALHRSRFPDEAELSKEARADSSSTSPSANGAERNSSTVSATTATAPTAADRRASKRVASNQSNANHGSNSSSSSSSTGAGSKKTDSSATTRATNAAKRVKLASESSSSGAPLRVNFGRLEMASLKKYQRYFKLETRQPNAGKQDLVRAISKHFAVEPKLRESQVISQFLFALRRGTKCDFFQLMIVDVPDDRDSVIPSCVSGN